MCLLYSYCGAEELKCSILLQRKGCRWLNRYGSKPQTYICEAREIGHCGHLFDLHKLLSNHIARRTCDNTNIVIMQYVFDEDFLCM